jgi:hypothetical protein
LAIFTPELFWELFNVASGGTSTQITEVLDSIIKSDRTLVSNYFDNVIDQISHSTPDYYRLRELFIDLFATHRAITTQMRSVSDPHMMTNSQLDELFRSFGYDHSVILRGFDENPLISKINLFLDLVNLYKIKGTPQSMYQILQYYGITEVDIYELWLQKQLLLGVDELRFRGRWVAGSTLFNQSELSLPYRLLTIGDPHWIYTEDQIRQLYNINKINLPSISPYFVIMPVLNVGPETAMFIRFIQDQYESWYNTRVLPEQNCEVTCVSEIRSLLEVYLAAVYVFQLNHSTGYKGDQFFCYDGTSDVVTEAAQIVDEYDAIMTRPITRYNKPFKIREMYDQFNRETPRHFLQEPEDAGYLLSLISPTFKQNLDDFTELDDDTLKTLLKDMGVWIRNNFGFGFVNTGFFTFGLAGLFEDLNPVINFFKPYRARLIIIENIQFNNWLEDFIPIDDSLDHTVDQITHDFMTADSIPCCGLDHIDSTAESVCIDTTSSTFYSRDTYDCGSYHDIGAVSDIKQEAIFVECACNLESSLICLPNPAVIEETPIPFDSTAATSWPITLLEGDPTSTDATADVLLYQISGFQDHDETGTFDCMGGFDHVFIQEEFIGGYLKGNWTPDGGYLFVKHDGGHGNLILNR